MEERPFLPDLGELIRKQQHERPVVFSGLLSMHVLSRYAEEYHSISGYCAFDQTSYAVTFDFGDKQWRVARRLLEEELYLDTGRFLPEPDSAAVEFDPVLPVAIEFEVTPKKVEQSEIGEESFTPLEVVRVHKIGLASGLDVIQRRHDWWVRMSRSRWNIGSSAVRRLCASIATMNCRAGELDYSEFVQNLVACHLALGVLKGQDLPTLVDKLVGSRVIKSGDQQTLIDTMAREVKGTTADLDECRSEFISLLIWYIALRIFGHAGLGSLERELTNAWGFARQGGQELLIMEARYSLARHQQPAFPRDVIEDRIGQLVREHDGIRAIMERRIGAYPAEIWEHPELPAVVEKYAMYDTLRAVCLSPKRDLVPQELAHRCEDNVKMITRWLRQCTELECSLFWGGAQAESDVAGWCTSSCSGKAPALGSCKPGRRGQPSPWS